MTDQLHLAVALDGYGWHPQAWRATLASGAPSVLSGRYWAELARTAERGLLDFLTIDDTLMPQPGRRERIDPRRLAGRGDAVLVAARIAPATRHIGLIPVATVTHTEPFHISKAIATLDYVSHGRAGWQPRVSVTTHEAALFGRRDGSQIPLFEEAVEFVDVVRRLWDSWEDDALIRDVSTGRYVDTDKLHYIDFAGKYFSVKGPSITPRPPQGQPVVAALAHAGPVYEFAAASADLVFITPTDDASLRGILRGQVRRRAEGVCGCGGVVRRRRRFPLRLSRYLHAAQQNWWICYFEWQRLGIDGARLRPAVNATDLPVIVEEVVPMLQRAGRFRAGYQQGETLRARLGLPAAANRYAAGEESDPAFDPGPGADQRRRRRRHGLA